MNVPDLSFLDPDEIITACAIRLLRVDEREVVEDNQSAYFVVNHVSTDVRVCSQF